VHADGRIARLIGNPAEDRAETVGFAEWIFDAVATEPSDEKDCRRGSRSDSGTRDDQAHAVSSLRDRHVVYHCGVLEPFGRVWRQRDALAPRNRVTQYVDRHRIAFAEAEQVFIDVASGHDRPSIGAQQPISLVEA